MSGGTGPRVYRISADPDLLGPVLEALLMSRPDALFKSRSSRDCKGVKPSTSRTSGDCHGVEPFIYVGKRRVSAGVSLKKDFSTELFAAFAELFKSRLMVEVREASQLPHEYKVRLYHMVAQTMPVSIEEGQVAAENVHPAALLPVYFGPTRWGTSWARVAAGAALYDRYTDRKTNYVGTLEALSAVLNVLAKLSKEYREKMRQLAPEFATMLHEPMECGKSDAIYGDECHEPSNRCARWLLAPLAYWDDLGKEWHELACSCAAAAVAVTETFSPYHLWLLSNGVEELYLIYTPNTYPQLKYALSYAGRSARARIKRVLASSYNPHINYIIFKKLIKGERDVCYSPKLTGPLPVYLALKKLEKEGLLKKAT